MNAESPIESKLDRHAAATSLIGPVAAIWFAALLSSLMGSSIVLESVVAAATITLAQIAFLASSQLAAPPARHARAKSLPRIAPSIVAVVFLVVGFGAILASDPSYAWAWGLLPLVWAISYFRPF
jgi:hypothetical protein